MSNVPVLLVLAKALSKQEQEELLTQLENFVVLCFQVQQINKDFKKIRFAKSRICCHCAGTNVGSNGKNKYFQR